MKDDNLIDFEAHRAKTGAKVMQNQSRPDRGQEAEEALAKLRTTKRLTGNDHPIIARNLGRMITELDRSNTKILAKKILEDKWQKRKRYVQFPDEPNPVRYATSGGDFSTIIKRIANEKKRKGFDAANAMIETVNEALKGTSFRRPTRFRMPHGAGEAAFLLEAMDKVLLKLAQAADLAEYFALISKYPIFPTEHGPQRSSQLELRVDREPNDLHRWDQFVDDDELQNWIPWWAPKCVIGHLYVPFQTDGLRVPKTGVAAIAKVCGGEITPQTWETGTCSDFLDEYLIPEHIRPCRIWHRIPVWMVVLSTPSGLISCLYASIYYREEFQIQQSIADETYFSYDNAISPCFVGGIGEGIDKDTVYFNEFDDPHYVWASANTIHVIGEGVDTDVQNFKAEVLGNPWSTDDIPVWLHPHPVQQLLKLSTNSDAAKLFALSPRVFPKDLGFRQLSWGIEDSETVFRPAFADSVERLTPPVRQNTIAAYILRNFTDPGDKSIFESLKNDAQSKAAAARDLITGELSKFQDAFDGRYGQ